MAAQPALQPQAVTRGTKADHEIDEGNCDIGFVVKTKPAGVRGRCTGSIENIEDADVFCAVTNDDEANILSAMLAKRMGARKVMALINRAAYVDLVEAGSINIAISPQQVTIGSLLAHVRRGDVVKVHSLRRGAAEAIEAIAHGTEKESRVVGRRIEEIDLPKGTAIVALVRNDRVVIAHHDTVIETDDHVILFMTDRRKIERLEQLFQVGVSFV